jgi:hypothetical protein
MRCVCVCMCGCGCVCVVRSLSLLTFKIWVCCSFVSTAQSSLRVFIAFCVVVCSRTSGVIFSEVSLSLSAACWLRLFFPLETCLCKCIYQLNWHLTFRFLGVPGPWTQTRLARPGGGFLYTRSTTLSLSLYSSFFFSPAFSISIDLFLVSHLRQPSSFPFLFPSPSSYFNQDISPTF